MKYDKLNGDIAFREADHKYFNIKDLSKEYISVTTLIHKYYPQFDEEFWSRYKALQKLVGEEEFDGPLKSTGKRGPASPAKRKLLDRKVFDYTLLDYYDLPNDLFEETARDIRASYKDKRDRACIRGSKYHNVKENHYYTREIHQINPLLPLEGEFLCQQNNFDLTRERAILPEFLLYFTSEDGNLNIAGQADLIIKDGNDIYILDYKTNADGIETKAYVDFKTKKPECMHYPVNNLHNHTLNHYTLQLSMYAWMLQRINPLFNIKMLKLLHIDGDNNETDFTLDYKKEEVERLLKHYKMTAKIQKARR